MAKITFICPHCFQKVKTKEIEYRCTNQRCKSYSEDDPEFSEYIGSGSIQKLGHVVKKSGKLISFGVPKPVACDSCGQQTVRICPYCHNIIPESSLLGDDNIISIIGTRSSGKSLYIAVLIQELKKRVAPSLGAAMNGLTDLSGLYNAEEIYKNTKYNQLYESLEVLEQTEVCKNIKGLGSQDDKRPLIYNFKYINGEFGRKDSFTFSFFDAAGEDQEDQSMASTVMRYIQHSKGIIFLIDPLQIPECLEKVEQNLGHKSYSTGTGGNEALDPCIVLSNMTSLIRTSLEMEGSNKKIEIPVAIAFSKFDAISSIVPSDLMLQKTSPHCGRGAFFEPDALNVGNEMKSILKSWDQQPLLNSIEANYDNFSFFGVSSLGFDNEPQEGKKVNSPRPHRVEDPLLWIMSQNKLISKVSN